MCFSISLQSISKDPKVLPNHRANKDPYQKPNLHRHNNFPRSENKIPALSCDFPSIILTRPRK